jgi:hypothetical protein
MHSSTSRHANRTEHNAIFVPVESTSKVLAEAFTCQQKMATFAKSDGHGTGTFIMSASKFDCLATAAECQEAKTGNEN